MKWCRECGAQMEDDQKYCSECGAGQVETEAEIDRENIVNRPSGERKKRNIPPVLIILLIGMVIITGVIFLLEYKSNGSGGRGSKESVISAVSTEEKETSTQSQKADDKNETEEEKEVESEADQETESTDNTEKVVKETEAISSMEKTTQATEQELPEEDGFILKYSREFFCLDSDVNALITVTPVGEKEVKIDIVFPDSYEFEFYGEVINKTSVVFTLDAGEKIHMIWSDEYDFEVYPDDGFKDESIQMVLVLCEALNYKKYNINAG